MIDPILLSTRRLAVISLLLLVGSWCGEASGELPRVLPPGTLPADARLQPLKDLDGYFPFEVSPSPEQWQTRKQRLRRQVLVSQGLWPMPTKTPLNAVIHGRIDLDDYSVEKVYFESFPGLYVTGNLYRPKDRAGRLPGVLCPHGHWSNGRFHDAGLQSVRQEIVDGGERFEDGGRNPLQSRCVQLARMGCVVFHYDMIGYADSQQITSQIAHEFSRQRPQMNDERDWGLYSPQAESNLQSVMGMQTYNSIRALDFLISLPDVDQQRLAITGASGGGTQSFMMAAIDDRLAVAFPAVMVSTAMQGGCTCENACLLRVGTGNVELAAMFAPKPLGLTAADDWTVEMSSKGFPQLQQHYAMLGARDNVMLKSLTHFGHNYNYVSRAAMYSWLNRHFKLGIDQPVVEEDYRRLGTAELTVWDDQHPAPPGGAGLERSLLRWWNEDSQKQLAALTPSDESTWRSYRELVGGAVDAIIGQGLPAADQLQYEQLIKNDRGSYLELAGLLTSGKTGQQLPILFLHPAQWTGQVAIWPHPRGKAGLYGDNDQPRPEVRRLLDAGASVVSVDLLYQGEFLAAGQLLTETRRVSNNREAAAYTFGYNDTVFAQRVHDLLAVISFVHSHEQRPQKIWLLGLEGAGPWAAAARAQAGEAIDRAAIDTQAFRFASIRRIHDPDFLPGGAKYHDLIGILSLSAPNDLWIAGEQRSALEVIEACYRSAGAADHLAVDDSSDEKRVDAAVQWLVEAAR